MNARVRWWGQYGGREWGRGRGEGARERGQGRGMGMGGGGVMVTDDQHLCIGKTYHITEGHCIFHGISLQNRKRVYIISF